MVGYEIIRHFLWYIRNDFPQGIACAQLPPPPSRTLVHLLPEARDNAQQTCQPFTECITVIVVLQNVWIFLKKWIAIFYLCKKGGILAFSLIGFWLFGDATLLDRMCPSYLQCQLERLTQQKGKGPRLCRRVTDCSFYLWVMFSAFYVILLANIEQQNQQL